MKRALLFLAFSFLAWSGAYAQTVVGIIDVGNPNILVQITDFEDSNQADNIAIIVTNNAGVPYVCSGRIGFYNLQTGSEDPSWAVTGQSTIATGGPYPLVSAINPMGSGEGNTIAYDTASCSAQTSSGGSGGTGSRGTPLEIIGNVSYREVQPGPDVQIKVDQVFNTSQSTTSGSLRLELWALTAPMSGNGVSPGGGAMAKSPLPSQCAGRNSTLAPHTGCTSIDLTTSLIIPPEGTWYSTLFLTQYDPVNCPVADRYCWVSYVNFPGSFAITSGGSRGDSAGAVNFVGGSTYNLSNGELTITVNELINSSTSRTTGSLRLDVWALTKPYVAGQPNSGYELLTEPLQNACGLPGSQLSPSQNCQNMSFRQNVMTTPPAGTYYVSTFVEEYDNVNCMTTSHYCVDSAINYTGTLSISPTTNANTNTNGNGKNNTSGGGGGGGSFDGLGLLLLGLVGAIRCARAAPYEVRRGLRHILGLFGLSLLLTACGGGDGSDNTQTQTDTTQTQTATTYTVGGTITGLTASGLVIANGGQTASAASGATSFTVSTQVSSGTSYNVIVQTQPTGETCTVASGRGTVGSQNVSVAVTCTTNTYIISGTIAGLTASGLVLSDGNQTVSPAPETTSFSFPTPLTAGTAYGTAVQTQPTGLTCVISGANGVAGSSNANILVVCGSGYTISGTITGLPSAAPAIVLTDGPNGTVPTWPPIQIGSFTGQGLPFIFPPLPTGTKYTVSVQTQPHGYTCTVANGTGTIGASNVSNVSVTCGKGTWTKLAPMPTPRGNLAAAVVNSILYTIGGLPSTTFTACSNSVEAYDPSTNQWTELAPYPFTGYGMSAVTINNIIYVFGGADCTNLNGAATAAVYAYDPTANSWTEVSSMPSGGLVWMGSATDGTSAYLVGGYNSSAGADMNTIQIYDPAANSWTTSTGPTTQGAGAFWSSTNGGAALVIFGGTCCGGGVGLPDNPYTEYLYFPDSKTLFREPNTTVGVAYPAIGVDGTSMLVSGPGGSTSGPTLICLLNCTAFPPPLASPSVNRIDFGGAVINGTFYLVGGYLFNGAAYNAGTGALEAYQP